MEVLPPVIFLMGPTASGKTDLAVNLVEQLPLEIISVDSVMVYRGMDIGSAKPDREILNKAPHRLIDIRDPSESYSAAEFRADACTAIQDIHRRGRIPLLVGGTFLYFRALEHGLADLPPASEAVRVELAAAASRIGWTGMHERLGQIDPIAAQRIHPNDPQRIQRALEVYEITGKSLTEIQRAEADISLPFSIQKIIVSPVNRQSLAERFAGRFQQMIRQGLIEEVCGLKGRGDLHSDLPSMRAVGYRQVWAYLSGEMDYDEMCRQAIQATNQYAKRQLTWLRAENTSEWLDPLDPDLTAKALKNTSSISM